MKNIFENTFLQCSVFHMYYWQETIYKKKDYFLEGRRKEIESDITITILCFLPEKMATGLYDFIRKLQ